MLKNCFPFIIFLLFVTFISNADTDNVATSEHTESETYFERVIHLVKRSIIYKVAMLVKSLLTIPATHINNIDNVLEYINTFVDLTGNFDDLKVYIRFQLYTPVNPYKKFELELSHESFHESKFNSSLDTKFLIHGFRERLSPTSIIYDIRDQLFQKGNYNIIVVDWTFHSQPPYDDAAMNAVFVGYEIAKLIKVLIYYKGVSPKSFHLIAHSLGCHAAGHAGKTIPNLGRITSLDATGLLFDDLPSSLKITDTDAEFVDAIHTHGSSILTEGLGTLFPYGDIDFFPNGGSLQPGCSFGDVYIDTQKQVKLVNTHLDFIFCNHQRALHLFLESINECRFESVVCNGYDDFKDGKCPHDTLLTSQMGFYAKKIESLEPNTAFYLETNDQYPFCFENV